MSIRDDLKAFLDGELTPERAAEVQAAIDRDPALRDEVQFMKILSGEIQDASREPQADGAERAVGRVVRRRPATWKWGAYAATGLAGLFLIGLVGTKLFPLGGEEAVGFERAGAAKADSAKTATGAVPAASSPSGSEESPPGSGMVTKSPQAELDALKAPPAGGGGKTLNEESAGDELEGTAPDYRPESPDSTTAQGQSGYVAGVAPDRGSSSDLTKKEFTRGRSPAERPKTGGAVAKVAGANTYAQPATSVPGVEAARKVVRNADMGVKVKDVRKSVAEVERQVNAMNGFVGDTRYDGRQDSSTATMQFQVPEKSFVAMLDTLRRLGTVEHENVTGQDVTAAIADGKGRITALADEEQNLIKELQRARQSDVRLEIRRRLSSVRQDISGLKAQNKALEGLADMSRVSLTLTQSGQLDEANPNDWFGQTTKGAGDLLGFFGRFIGVGVIYLVFMAPVWLPVAGIVWWARKRASK